ncbi:hypothetical protein PY092_08990 [Muricauda sp. 334s03]|uniref:DUF4252 domain-containing protein n=1 Tax=Flagellimonas yonaguniensis TaxID=3031325 RepID=A0ABT5XYL9_9FLAO|nr:hypothetical protein [[Muricauda] yonaguniensis]MDF0716280.1 hypothetical protein [[Muricauda] yonaguniensis]
MVNKLTFLFVLLIFSCTSCKNEKTENNDSETTIKDFNTVSIDNEYHIKMPRFLKGTTGLNEEASLQYQSLLREAYVIIIDEPKKGFEEVYRDLEQYDDALSVIQNYRGARLKILSRTSEINSKSEPKSIKIHGLDAEALELDAKVNGLDNDISYFLTFVDGREKVYMIMCWTLKNQKEEHKKTFKTIAESFELID